MIIRDMTNEEILKRALKKALRNGYKPFTYDGNNTADFIVSSVCQNANWSGLWCYETIFSHDFAKAFWGEGYIVNDYGIKGCKHTSFAWQYHLRQMVLKENPIKYLEKYL